MKSGRVFLFSVICYKKEKYYPLTVNAMFVVTRESKKLLLVNR